MSDAQALDALLSYIENKCSDCYAKSHSGSEVAEMVALFQLDIVRDILDYAKDLGLYVNY